MQVSFRRAQSHDRDAVMSIADRCPYNYLEQVFPDWVQEESGGLFFAEVEGAVGGFAHLTYVTPTEAWLAGMRVDPSLQGKGLATLLSSYLIDAARAHGATKARLVTEPVNAGAH